MKNHPLLGHTKKFAGISAIAIMAMGAVGCVSQSEKEFQAQNGFKRSDYFGKKNSKFVPSAAKDNRHVDQVDDGSTSGLSIK